MLRPGSPGIQRQTTELKRLSQPRAARENSADQSLRNENAALPAKGGVGEFSEAR